MTMTSPAGSSMTQCRRLRPWRGLMDPAFANRALPTVGEQQRTHRRRARVAARSAQVDGVEQTLSHKGILTPTVTAANPPARVVAHQHVVERVR